MKTKEKARGLANENITELNKEVNVLHADIDYICEKIYQVRSLYKAMHYGIAEGALCESEIDECMSAFRDVMDNLGADTEVLYSANFDM